MGDNETDSRRLIMEESAGEKTKLTKAYWEVYLNADCPECGKEINIWDIYTDLQVGEETKLCMDCPNCKKEIEVDVFY